MKAPNDMFIRWEAADARHELDEAHDAASEAAAKRVQFQLTYDRTDPREFGRHEVDGPMMPNAYGPGQQWGMWSDFDDPAEPTEDAWIDKYARMAIGEAVHEALEWFRVDGKPWIDPHSMELEAAVMDEVNALCVRLAQLRRETPNDNDPRRNA